jgi:hypothetical protein
MPSPVQIVITVEGGAVGSVLCTVPACITLIDFDNIEAGGNIETWDYDADGAQHDIAEAMAAGQAAIEQGKNAAEEIAQVERKSEYVRSGGGPCPYCGSINVQPAAIDAGAGQLTQPIRCPQCGKRWSNVYRLAELKEDGA